jgi:hypothetical protein
MKARLSVGLALFALLGTSVPALTGCDFINTPTKVANGQLYESGDAKYDPYFSTVHQEQVAAASWPDQSKAARKPIVTALDLRPGASNSTILASTRDKKGDPAVGRAVDETIAGERDFSKHLVQSAEKLEELKKQGEELKKQAAEDRKNLAADKADEKKVAKKDEVKHEMSAAVDAVESMVRDARKASKEADDLVSKLKGAWTGRDDDGPPPDVKKEEKKDDKKEEKEEKKDDKKKPGPPVAKKPAVKPEAPPAAKKPAKPEPTEKPEPAPVAKKPPKPEPAEKPDKPEPKPAPAQKPPDEVFNP